MKVYELINELAAFPGGEEVFVVNGEEGALVLTVAGEPAIDLPIGGVDIQPAGPAEGQVEEAAEGQVEEVEEAAVEEVEEAAVEEAAEGQAEEPAEFAEGALAGIKFASDAAADKANGLGLVADDFEEYDPSGAKGFTVADVVFVEEMLDEVEADEAAEAATGEEAD